MRFFLIFICIALFVVFDVSSLGLGFANQDPMLPNKDISLAVLTAEGILVQSNPQGVELKSELSVSWILFEPLVSRYTFVIPKPRRLTEWTQTTTQIQVNQMRVRMSMSTSSTRDLRPAVSPRRNHRITAVLSGPRLE